MLQRIVERVKLKRMIYDIGVIVQMPPPLVMLTQVLVPFMVLIGLMMIKRKNKAPNIMLLKQYFNLSWIE